MSSEAFPSSFRIFIYSASMSCINGNENESVVLYIRYESIVPNPISPLPFVLQLYYTCQFHALQKKFKKMQKRPCVILKNGVYL